MGNMNSLDEEYVTIKEATKRLKRHPRTIWLWTVVGKIPYFQPLVGGKILIPLSAINKVLHSGPSDK
jgi:excisionase family DNA binding protein